jgi:glycosyltransferase involved in cell wall biosynthesis
MPAQPDVTVVIPTRDRYPVLQRCALRAAFSQKAVRLEVIVVDDGSGDCTAAYLSERDDPRLLVVRHPEPEGVAAARNSGLERARGKWVAFLDDDDLWAPDKLRSQLELAEETGSGFVYSSAVIINEEFTLLDAIEAPPPADLKRKLLRRNVIPAGQSNVLVQTAVLQEIGGFDTQLSALADWDCWVRLAHRAEGAACRAMHVAYVFHDRNMHALQSDIGAEFRHLSTKHWGIRKRRPSPDVLAARWRAFAYRRTHRRDLAAREYLRSAWRDRSSGQLLRAGGALLGERVMRWGVPGRRIRSVSAPLWLRLYQDAKLDGQPPVPTTVPGPGR